MFGYSGTAAGGPGQLGLVHTRPAAVGGRGDNVVVEIKLGIITSVQTFDILCLIYVDT